MWQPFSANCHELSDQIDGSCSLFSGTGLIDQPRVQRQVNGGRYMTIDEAMKRKESTILTTQTRKMTTTVRLSMPKTR